MAEPTIPRTTVADFTGNSPGIRELRRQFELLSRHDVNVVLHGESGTGKELAARVIHGCGKRSDGPFVGVNCAAIHETLLESLLFGHQAGAFTGATSATPGFLRAADGGTILLDEIGDMGPALQSKLLRVLEERSVVPVGSTRPVTIDVRVLAATHRDLAAAVREGTFREDLYYRLNVVCLRIPPLRERLDDVPVLAERLGRKIARTLDLPVKPISAEAMAVLVRHTWPGNVRELGNVLQHAYVLGQGREIDLADLPATLGGEGKAVSPVFPTLQETTRRQIVKALERTSGVRVRAAELLGVNRKHLWRMMRQYGIS